jgi:hypothetical protein
MDRDETEVVMSGYADLIRELSPDHDPRHIEAYIRLEYGVLDHLSPERFALEASIAEACIKQGGLDAAEKLAVSYGL